MKVLRSKDVLAANLRAWAQRAGLVGSSHELSAKFDLPQKTVYNILHAQTNPYRSLDHIAGKISLHPWVLLCPDEGGDVVRIIRAYENTTEEGRRLLLLAAETAERLSRPGK